MTIQAYIELLDKPEYEKEMEEKIFDVKKLLYLIQSTKHDLSKISKMFSSHHKKEKEIRQNFIGDRYQYFYSGIVD